MVGGETQHFSKKGGSLESNRCKCAKTVNGNKAGKDDILRQEEGVSFAGDCPGRGPGIC